MKKLYQKFDLTRTFITLFWFDSLEVIFIKKACWFKCRQRSFETLETVRSIYKIVNAVQMLRKLSKAELTDVINSLQENNFKELKPYFSQIDGTAEIEVYAENIFDAINLTMKEYKSKYWKKTEVEGTDIQFRIWNRYGDTY